MCIPKAVNANLRSSHYFALVENETDVVFKPFAVHFYEAFAALSPVAPTFIYANGTTFLKQQNIWTSQFKR